MTGDAEVWTQIVLDMLAKQKRAEEKREAARRKKREDGGYIGGAPPYGKAVQDGELVEVEDEATLVRLVMALHSSGASLRQIAKALDAEGIRPRRGNQWHPQTISNILKQAGCS